MLSPEKNDSVAERGTLLCRNDLFKLALNSNGVLDVNEAYAV